MTTIGLTTRDVARELARRYSTMTHEELDVLESILVPMKFQKGEVIVKEGDVCTNIYWVVKGLVRQYYYKNGKELTEYMATENTICMCIESLFKEEPSRQQSVKLCATRTSRCFIVRFWKNHSSSRRFMPTCCALSLLLSAMPSW